MSGEHLTDLATSWTTIRNAHTPGPAGQVAMHELIGCYFTMRSNGYLKLKAPRLEPGRRGLSEEFWTKLLTRRRSPGADSNKGRFARLPPNRSPSPDRRPHILRVKKPAPPLGDLLDDARQPDADAGDDRTWREVVIAAP